MPSEDRFDWKVYPETGVFVNGLVAAFLKGNRFAASLSKKMYDETSTRFIDWVDHIQIPSSEYGKSDLAKVGYKKTGTCTHGDVYRNDGTYLFPIILNEDGEFRVAVKPEEIESFILSLGLGIVPEGRPFSAVRRADLNKEGTFILSAVERRGGAGFEASNDDDIKEYLESVSGFMERKRIFRNDIQGIEYTKGFVEGQCSGLGTSRAADAFFRAERLYWQRRNRAGQIQKSRQDKLGLGWGNHDHHTYRSSREHLVDLIELFEIMGYECRERYYAGAKAGWGAQILEHKECEIVIFTDVDLNEDETGFDYAHERLAERKELGTVGLWIALNGESILQAGMHHLEARFDFEKLRKDLPLLGIKVMQPFSYFEFLKQAFTEGERWAADESRAKKVLERGAITEGQYEEFLKGGVIGSHMENLQRDNGFKGFNKASVTKIIRETDPRLEHFGGA